MIVQNDRAEQPIAADPVAGTKEGLVPGYYQISGLSRPSDKSSRKWKVKPELNVRPFSGMARSFNILIFIYKNGSDDLPRAVLGMPPDKAMD